jgi:hypothetical protein
MLLNSKVRHSAPVVFPVDVDGGENVYRVHPIYVQLVTDQVIMPAKKEHGCDSVSESLDKRMYKSDRFGGRRVMVWTEIYHDGRKEH